MVVVGGSSSSSTSITTSGPAWTSFSACAPGSRKFLLKRRSATSPGVGQLRERQLRLPAKRIDSLRQPSAHSLLKQRGERLAEENRSERISFGSEMGPTLRHRCKASGQTKKEQPSKCANQPVRQMMS